MSAEDCVPISALAMALIAFPLVVYGIAWALTLGHWENSHYKRPAAIFAIAMAVLVALVFVLNLA